jgi:hypothetical protein
MVQVYAPGPDYSEDSDIEFNSNFKSDHDDYGEIEHMIESPIRRDVKRK